MTWEPGTSPDFNFILAGYVSPAQDAVNFHFGRIEGTLDATLSNATVLFEGLTLLQGSISAQLSNGTSSIFSVTPTTEYDTFHSVLDSVTPAIYGKVVNSVDLYLQLGTSPPGNETDLYISEPIEGLFHAELRPDIFYTDTCVRVVYVAPPGLAADLSLQGDYEIPSSLAIRIELSPCEVEGGTEGEFIATLTSVSVLFAGASVTGDFVSTLAPITTAISGSVEAPREGDFVSTLGSIATVFQALAYHGDFVSSLASFTTVIELEVPVAIDVTFVNTLGNVVGDIIAEHIEPIYVSFVSTLAKTTALFDGIVPIAIEVTFEAVTDTIITDIEGKQFATGNLIATTDEIVVEIEAETAFAVDVTLDKTLAHVWSTITGEVPAAANLEATLAPVTFTAEGVTPIAIDVTFVNTLANIIPNIRGIGHVSGHFIATPSELVPSIVGLTPIAIDVTFTPTLAPVVWFSIDSARQGDFTPTLAPVAVDIRLSHEVVATFTPTLASVSTVVQGRTEIRASFVATVNPPLGNIRLEIAPPISGSFIKDLDPVTVVEWTGRVAAHGKLIGELDDLEKPESEFLGIGPVRVTHAEMVLDDTLVAIEARTPGSITGSWISNLSPVIAFLSGNIGTGGQFNSVTPELVPVFTGSTATIQFSGRLGDVQSVIKVRTPIQGTLATPTVETTFIAFGVVPKSVTAVIAIPTDSPKAFFKGMAEVVGDLVAITRADIFNAFTYHANGSLFKGLERLRSEIFLKSGPPVQVTLTPTLGDTTSEILGIGHITADVTLTTTPIKVEFVSKVPIRIDGGFNSFTANVIPNLTLHNFSLYHGPFIATLADPEPVIKGLVLTAGTFAATTESPITDLQILTPLSVTGTLHETFEPIIPEAQGRVAIRGGAIATTGNDVFAAVGSTTAGRFTVNLTNAVVYIDMMTVVRVFATITADLEKAIGLFIGLVQPRGSLLAVTSSIQVEIKLHVPIVAQLVYGAGYLTTSDLISTIRGHQPFTHGILNATLDSVEPNLPVAFIVQATFIPTLPDVRALIELKTDHKAGTIQGIIPGAFGNIRLYTLVTGFVNVTLNDIKPDIYVDGSIRRLITIDATVDVGVASAKLRVDIRGITPINAYGYLNSVLESVKLPKFVGIAPYKHFGVLESTTSFLQSTIPGHVAPGGRFITGLFPLRPIIRGSHNLGTLEGTLPVKGKFEAIIVAAILGKLELRTASVTTYLRARTLIRGSFLGTLAPFALAYFRSAGQIVGQIIGGDIIPWRYPFANAIRSEIEKELGYEVNWDSPESKKYWTLGYASGNITMYHPVLPVGTISIEFSDLDLDSKPLTSDIHMHIDVSGTMHIELLGYAYEKGFKIQATFGGFIAEGTLIETLQKLRSDFKLRFIGYEGFLTSDFPHIEGQFAGIATIGGKVLITANPPVGNINLQVPIRIDGIIHSNLEPLAGNINLNFPLYNWGTLLNHSTTDLAVNSDVEILVPILVNIFTITADAKFFSTGIALDIIGSMHVKTSRVFIKFKGDIPPFTSTAVGISAILLNLQPNVSGFTKLFGSLLIPDLTFIPDIQIQVPIRITGRGDAMPLSVLTPSIHGAVLIQGPLSKTFDTITPDIAGTFTEPFFVNLYQQTEDVTTEMQGYVLVEGTMNLVLEETSLTSAVYIFAFGSMDVVVADSIIEMALGTYSPTIYLPGEKRYTVEGKVDTCPYKIKLKSSTFRLYDSTTGELLDEAKTTNIPEEYSFKRVSRGPYLVVWKPDNTGSISKVLSIDVDIVES